MQKTTLGPELQVSMAPSPHLFVFFCIHNSVILTRINSLYGSQTSPLIVCMQNNVISTRINSLYGSQTSPVALCVQNSVISTRITSLHGSQTSPVGVSMQNNVISIRITSLYWSQPSFVVFPCKTATLGTELLISIGPRSHLWFF